MRAKKSDATSGVYSSRKASLSLSTGAGRLRRSAAEVDEIEDREGFIKHRLAKYLVYV